MITVEAEDCTFLTLYYEHGLVTEEYSIEDIIKRQTQKIFF